MSKLFNVSSSPHFRSEHTVGKEMWNVVLALMPATFFGVYHFGLHALLVILTSVVSATFFEFLYDYIAHKPNTLWDGSAIVTGLLLALCLSPKVPLFIPFIGSMFAIIIAKNFFGGLGKNFMNPALAGRVFLIISFGKLMTDYAVDGMSSATPLATLNGGGTVDMMKMFLGFATGHIGVSILCLLIGGIFLLATGTITWQIPVSSAAVFAIMMLAFGPAGFDLKYLVVQLVGGGFILGIFFMATDPVSSPMTNEGQLIFGALVGFLAALFRLKSSMTDGMSYAIIIANLFTPIIDKYVVVHPWGVGKPVVSAEAKAQAKARAEEQKKAEKEALAAEKAEAAKAKAGETKKGFTFPVSAAILCCITLIAGAALAGVNMMTADTIKANQEAAALAAYEAVQPQADHIGYDDALSAAVEALGGEVYGTSYGRVYINEGCVGLDASGNIVGYAFNVSSMDGYDGEIALSIGFDTEGTLLGISFTTINETAGMGMLADTDAWKAQFSNVKVDSFTLIKAGGSTADDEIDSVSGASTTSGAVVNAVNAAIDFYQKNCIG